MKTVLRYCKVFLLLIAAYFAFAVLSCLIPDKSIKANIEKSAPLLEKEGLYPKAIVGLRQCQMDNYTDALILNQIYRIDRKRPVLAAMKVVHAEEPGHESDKTGMLLRLTNGESLKDRSYARYWHGNTFLFRPFFLLMDYNMLRWWLFAISTLLLVALLCAYYQGAGLLKTMALAFGFVATCGFVTQFSMQFFPVLAITVVACLLVIKRGDTKDNGLLFFIVGSLVCYFDLLTAPMLTLGMPLVVWLSLKHDESIDVRKDLWVMFRMGLLWILGFALTFVTKWALGSMIVGNDVFSDALGTSLYRIGVDDFTRWDAVVRNFNLINLPMVLVFVMVFVVLLVVRRPKFSWKKALLLLLLGLTPYIWYLVLSNHSYLHWWFTYRLQAITVACLMLMLAEPFRRTA